MGPRSVRVWHGVVWGSVLLLACEGPTVPGGGGIAVSGTVSGGSDPNGFELVVDRRAAVPFDGVGPLVFAPVAAGTHRLELGGLSGNCRPEAPAVQEVSVQEGDTAAVDFSVACESPGGALEISVSTGGLELDPNGFTVTIDGSPAGRVDRNGRFSGSTLPGMHSVGLDDLTPNCIAGEANPQNVLFAAGGLVSLHFEIACTAAPPAGRGHEFALVSNVGEDSAAYLMNEDGTGTRVLLSSPDTSFIHPMWSPDGSHLLVATFWDLGRSGNLRVLDLASGTTTEIPKTEGATAPAWSPDGRRIVFVGSDFRNLFLVELNGDEPRRLTEEVSSSATQPSWSPDGNRIAYIHDDGINLSLRVITLANSSVRVLDETEAEFSDLSDPQWSPDGNRIAYFHFQGSIGGSLKVIAPADLSVLVLADTEEESSTFVALTWSPDGGSIAFTVFNPSGHQIFVVPADTPAPRALTRDLEDNSDLTWSPDSRRIGFVSNRDGTPELYVMNADGTNQTRITNNELDDGQPAWRP